METSYTQPNICFHKIEPAVTQNFTDGSIVSLKRMLCCADKSHTTTNFMISVPQNTVSRPPNSNHAPLNLMPHTCLSRQPHYLRKLTKGGMQKYFMVYL